MSVAELNLFKSIRNWLQSICLLLCFNAFLLIVIGGYFIGHVEYAKYAVREGVKQLEENVQKWQKEMEAASKR